MDKLDALDALLNAIDGKQTQLERRLAEKQQEAEMHVTNLTAKIMDRFCEDQTQRHEKKQSRL